MRERGVLLGHNSAGYRGRIVPSPDVRKTYWMEITRGSVFVHRSWFDSESQAKRFASKHFGKGWRWFREEDVITNSLMKAFRRVSRSTVRELDREHPEHLLAMRFSRDELYALCAGHNLDPNPEGTRLDLAVLFVERIGRKSALRLLGLL